MKFWHAGVGILGLIALGILWYGFSPLLVTVRLDEKAPTPLAPLTQEPQENPLRAAPVLGTFGHPAEGTARTIEAEGKMYIRYENFKTLNGPDLYVYLSKDLEASDFVDLGRLRATEGNINYEIPAGVMVEDYSYALVWCKQFGVLFNSAKIN